MDKLRASHRFPIADVFIGIGPKEKSVLIKHAGAHPKVDSTAYVASNAVVCGDVTIGPGVRILHGAQIIAEAGSISIGKECIVMENAVLRSSARHSLHIGNNCLVGPNAHLVGCTIEDEVFIATGAAVFHSAWLGKGTEVQINGVVHLKTHLGEKSVVPIGWIAVGNPAQILAPSEHERIWKIQKPLNFPLVVYGLDRSEATMEKITRNLSAALGSHVLDEPSLGGPAKFGTP
jgi:carbonic anhydrase/acetyltransferase-like protein (isoleucine patch superfamily)